MSDCKKNFVKVSLLIKLYLCSVLNELQGQIQRGL